MLVEPDLVAFAVSTLGDLADRPVITVEEAARVLGVGRSAAYEAVRAGQIPSWRIGHRIVVPVAALVARLIELEAAPRSHPGVPVEADVHGSL